MGERFVHSPMNFEIGFLTLHNSKEVSFAAGNEQNITILLSSGIIKNLLDYK
jgi:hypothetical protein